MEIRRSVCPHDCPDTCAWQVEIENNKIVRVSGDPKHEITQGVICDKAKYYPERVYGKQRVLYPMKRSGPKGSGSFSRISWDEALSEITEQWHKIIENHGPESILPYSYAGTEGVINKASMDCRFFNKLGSTQLERTICSAAGGAGFALAYGHQKGINPLDTVNSKLIIFWGINALETNLHQALIANEARRQGANIICIDVHRNKTAAWADDFYHIMPGTDGALAMGIAHIILRDGLEDTEWLASHSSGFEEFAKACREYPPDKVAKITGLKSARIEKLAHLYAAVKPSFIRIGNGFQHHDNGGMSTWAVACLPALTGAWQYKGGGATKSNAGYFPLDKKAIERPDLISGTPRKVNMNQLGRALNELDPPILSMYVYNSNPAAVAPNQALVLQGLAREDLFTVVHEQVWTDTARWADIVLPATTHLEHQDLYVSYWHLSLQWAEPVISPLGESRPNIEVFRELANRMGFTDSCFRDSTEDIARQALNTPYWQNQGFEFEGLLRERSFTTKTLELSAAEYSLPTDSGRIELASKKTQNFGLPPVPCHMPLKEGSETVGSVYPLMLISPPHHLILNSTFADVESIRNKISTPVIEINPTDAVARGIVDGDLVEAYNLRGNCVLVAKVTDAVLAGVTVALGVWWPGQYKNGRGINALTSDRLSDLGRGAVFFSNLVEVRRFNE